MKIITEENGIQKLYVQRFDLAKLPCLLEDEDLAVIYWIGLRTLSEITEQTKDEFVLVENEQLIKFIERSNYILNYHDFIMYGVKELQEKVKQLKKDAFNKTGIALEQNKHMQLALLNLIQSKESKQYVDIPVSYYEKAVKQKTS